MKYDCIHGIKLSRALAHDGSRITEQGGVIFAAAHHGIDMPLDGYELQEAERSALNVLEAIEAYKAAADLADPPRYVPGSQGPHPRPGYHVQAGRNGPGGSPPVTRGHDRLLPCATLDALNGAGPDREEWARAFNTHEADGDDTPPEAA